MAPEHRKSWLFTKLYKWIWYDMVLSKTEPVSFVISATASFVWLRVLIPSPLGLSRNSFWSEWLRDIITRGAAASFSWPKVLVVLGAKGGVLYPSFIADLVASFLRKKKTTPPNYMEQKPKIINYCCLYPKTKIIVQFSSHFLSHFMVTPGCTAI